MRVVIEHMVGEFERGRMSRRELIANLSVLGAAIAGLPAYAATQTPPASTTQPANPADEPTFSATGLDHIALSVADVSRSREFYMRHLGLTQRGRPSESSCFLNAGPHFLALFRGQPRMHHYCYSVSGYTAASAVEKLEAAGLEPDRQGNRVYFPDPDGLIVQVAAGQEQ